MPDTDRLIQAIDAAEENSYGGDNYGDLQEDRARALDLYYGRNIEPAPEGRSQIVDRTVHETIHWMLPSLCRIFANGSNVVEFEPTGEEDEEPAQQESDYLNYKVMGQNPGKWFVTALSWMQDALISKNGYCMPQIEEKIQTEVEEYKGQSDEAVALLTEEDGVEVVEFESRPTGEMKTVVDETGQPVPMTDELGQPLIDEMGQMVPAMEPVMVHDISIRKTTPTKKLCFKVLPPERCKVDVHTDSFSLEDCDYFEYEELMSISELRSMGFDVEDDIASDTDDSDYEEYARDLYLDRDAHTEEINPIDPAMKLVRARMIWIRYDYDEDGISELNFLWRVGNTVLERDGKPYIKHASRVGVACITPMLNTHRHIGTSEADMAGDVQRVKTVMLRQGLDSLQLANNPRHAVSDKVDLDDMLISRPGGLVRLHDGAVPGEGHVMPIQTPFVFEQAMSGLQYMDHVNAGRTGISRNFSGVDPDVLNKSAASGVALNQVSTMEAQRVEQVARIFATGFQYLFSLAHELILKQGHQQETIRLRGKWVTVDPSAWKTGRDMRVVVGYGSGNKDALMARLTTIAAFQEKAAMAGLRIVDEGDIYNTMIELTKASDFSAPERFWTDPETVEPPPPQPDINMLMLESNERIEGEKIASDERIKQAELQHKDGVAALEDETKRFIAQLQADVDILIEQMKSGSTENLERVRAQLRVVPETGGKGSNDADRFEKAAQSLKESVAMAESIAQLAESMKAPKRVVRDENDRVVGLESG